jgi:hypothetical protein
MPPLAERRPSPEMLGSALDEARRVTLAGGGAIPVIADRASVERRLLSARSCS